MKRSSRLLAVTKFAPLLLAVLAAACTSNSQPAAKTDSTPVKEEDKQWTMPNKDYASTRYSSLNSINTENIKNLKVAWTFSTGVLRGHEGGPLVIGNTMYVHTPFPDIV